jgi:hypothetical protein
MYIRQSLDIDLFQDDSLPTHINIVCPRNTTDYIYCSKAFSHYLKDCNQEYINYN